MAATPRAAIPYPVVGDAPNLPLQMEAIALNLEDQAKDDQGTFSARPISTPGTPGKAGRYYWATDKRVLYRDLGTSWVTVYKNENSTTLPTTPTDCTLATLEILDTDTSNPFEITHWTFRYVSTEPTYKWLFVGGPPIAITLPNQYLFIRNSTSYGNIDPSLNVNPGIPAPSCFIPFPGIYEIEYGANMYNYGFGVDNGAALSLQFPASGPEDPASDNDSVMIHSVGTGADTDVHIMHHHCRRILKKTITPGGGGGSVRFQGKALGGGTATYRGLHMSIRPIQIASS